MEFPLKLKVSDRIEILAKLEPYLLSDDKKGHSWLMAARCPTWFGRIVDVIKEKKGSPYKTQSDVVRDALYLGLAILSVRHNAIPRWYIEATLELLVGETRNTSRIGEKVSELAKNLDDIMKMNKHKAVRLLKEYVATISQFDDKSYRQIFWSEMIKNQAIKYIADEGKIEIPPVQDVWKVTEE